MRLLILPAALLLVTTFAEDTRVFIGELYEHNLGDNFSVATGKDGKPLPSWLMVRNQILQGIPSEHDVGMHTVMIKPNGRKPIYLNLNVEEENNSVCGPGVPTFWMETYHEPEATLENMITSALAMSEMEVDPKVKTVRVYNYNFSLVNRELEEISQEAVNGNYMVMWKITCDDFDEAVNIMDGILEREDIDYDYIKLAKGFFKTGVAPKPTTIEPQETTVEYLRTTTELIRTTRKISDNKPILLNRLPSYVCTRGEMCELRVPAETFKDAEDGDTFKLRLSVLALDNAEVWMINEANKGLLGIPMRTGEFSYRLEARDSAGQLASAPFQVNVKPALPTNHRVQLEMDMPTPEQMATNPAKRNLLMRALARSLRAPVNSFTIQEIGSKNNKTMVAFSNNSIPYRICDEDALESMSAKMIMKQKMRTKTEFVKAMGNQFYVRRATLVRQGNCNEAVEISTTAPTIQSMQEADSQLLLICILLFLLLVIAVAIIVYCACIKKGGKKKSSSTEYVAKGLPVVFPDEVEEADPTHAGTPMLAREERPPLKVSQHENPLYKPPPPIASNSPRLGHASSSSNQKLQSPFIPP
uniref:Dystroglycan 1 n=1 Tax=Caenorhabditis japonica TaxID=281687 RepID=A0A8R1DXN7_CAEJA